MSPDHIRVRRTIRTLGVVIALAAAGVVPAGSAAADPGDGPRHVVPGPNARLRETRDAPGNEGRGLTRSGYAVGSGDVVGTGSFAVEKRKTRNVTVGSFSVGDYVLQLFRHGSSTASNTQPVPVVGCITVTATVSAWS